MDIGLDLMVTVMVLVDKVLIGLGVQFKDFIF